MTTFDQGHLLKSFTIRYLIVDVDASYFALIGKKTLNELRATISTPHLKMKFPTLTGEIVTCYAESLKVAPYPSTRKSARPHPTTGDDTQVMSVDKGSPGQAWTVYLASLDDVFDVDSCNDNADRGPKPIEELFKL
ncbi:hypothetical protein GmHk_12G034668 [Glycine max]|nr:hypothetical protein GmHk_12G034668 [Glycine max]